MHTRSIAILAAVLLSATTTALAQGGGSVYSMLGIGDLQVLPNARSAGMGNTGIGLYSTTSIHAWAPASWSRLDRVRMEGSLLSEGFRSTDGTRSQTVSKTAFQGILLGLPVAPADGITVVLGMTPYSRVNFDVVGPYRFSGREDTLDYSVRYKGTGGIGRAQLGASWAPLPDFSVGASFDFLFGSIERSVIITPVSSSYASGTASSITQVYGPSATVGVMLSGLDRIIPALQPLSLGAYASTHAALHTERLDQFNFASGSDTLYAKDDVLTIPFTVGIGAAYQLTPLTVIAADFSTQQWSRLQINGQRPEGIRDSYHLGAGIEFGGSKTFGASWWSRVGWRLGFAYTSTSYQVNGTPIDEWLATFGMTLPMYTDVTNDTRIVVAFQGGQRGTLDNSLVKDTVLRMMFSLNIGQVWFVSSRED